MKKILSILLLLSCFVAAWAQEQEMTVAERNAAQGFNDTIDRLAPDFVTVSLCIADPTDQSQDYLGMTGHAFLRLQCPTFGLDYCFSYESEKIKGQLWDYVTGKLKMGMYAVPTNEYIEDYRIWKRAVHEYRINMPPDAEQRLWEQMDNHMLAEQEMQMDLIKFGCANTLLRYVEHALSPTQIEYNWPEKFLTKSAMEIAEEHMENCPWTLLGLRVTAGREYAKMTTPKQKLIFPNDLLEVWSQATINEEPMLTYIGDLVEAEPVIVKKPWFTPKVCGILLMILAVGGMVWVIIRRRVNRKSPMSNLQCQISKYPLLPFSQLVYDMTRWTPSVYRFPVTLRWKDGAKEKDCIEQATRLALANHPVFSMQIDRRGMHYASEQNDILHGQYHDIDLSVDGKDVLIRVSASRILGDGRSAEILLEDIERAYKGLPLESDDYWGYVARYEQQKTEKHYANSCEWLKKEFADEAVPVRPTIDRRWIATLLPPKAGLYEDNFTALHEKIDRWKEEQFISYEGIFSLCVTLAIAEYCGTDEAALTWAYEGRETEDEQRIFGSLHRDIPFMISRKSKVESQKPASREELIREARNQIRTGIAHSDYPYTLAYPYSKRWNNAVNILRVEDVEDMLRKTSLPIEIISIPEQKYAYALLDIEIHEHIDSLQLVYRYSATHYKPESIRRFAELVRQHVEWLIESEE